MTMHERSRATVDRDGDILLVDPDDMVETLTPGEARDLAAELLTAATESEALVTLDVQQQTSRQEPTAEDRRLTAARALYEDLDSEQAPVLGDLIAFAEERLLVNRGLLAQQKAPEPTTNAQTDLADATDGELLQVCFDRGLITVSQA